MAHGRTVHRIRDRLALVGMVLLVFCAAAPGPARATDTSLEFAVKATFIYKFVPYVEWPAGAFASASSPVVICIVGSDGVSGQLDLAAAGQHADSRPIVLRHLPAVSRDVGCSVLYIAEGEGTAIADDLAAVKGAPILTVTDLDRTPGAAGMIAFTVVNGHVRFDIDEAAAAANGLAISSKLLSLANAVMQKP